MSDSIEVAVALMRRGRHLLLCQRSASAKYPLQWEFPGGKVEPGETAEAALMRELAEELAIRATPGALYHRQTSTYPDHGVFAVSYFIVEQWDGELVNNVFADFRWILPEELFDYDILEGNREVCRRLSETRD